MAASHSAPARDAPDGVTAFVVIIAQQIAANRGGDLLLSHLSDFMWKEVLAAERAFGSARERWCGDYVSLRRRWLFCSCHAASLSARTVARCSIARLLSATDLSERDLSQATRSLKRQ